MSQDNIFLHANKIEAEPLLRIVADRADTAHHAHILRGLAPGINGVNRFHTSDVPPTRNDDPGLFQSFRYRVDFPDSLTIPHSFEE